MTPEGISVSPSQFEVTNVPTEQPAPPEYRYTVDDQPQPPLLNRVQRRHLRRYVKHKAALQMRHVHAKNNQASWIYAARQSNRCNRCGLWPIPAPTAYRCQCQVEQRRQCRMCGVDCMASSRAWRQTNVCYACAAQIAYQRENEEASAAAAQERWYAMREAEIAG
jgi:hypothetical protein